MKYEADPVVKNSGSLTSGFVVIHQPTISHRHPFRYHLPLRKQDKRFVNGKVWPPITISLLRLEPILWLKIGSGLTNHQQPDSLRLKTTTASTQRLGLKTTYSKKDGNALWKTKRSSLKMGTFANHLKGGRLQTHHISAVFVVANSMEGGRLRRSWVQ